MEMRGLSQRRAIAGAAARFFAVHTPFDLTNQLERVGIGRTIDLAVRRDGKTATMAVDVVDVDPRR
jgi:hypothetical protein